MKCVQPSAIHPTECLSGKLRHKTMPLRDIVLPGVLLLMSSTFLMYVP